MNLSEIFDINARQLKALNAAKILTAQDLLDCKPKHYYNLDDIRSIRQMQNGEMGCVTATLVTIKNKISASGRRMTMAVLTEDKDTSLLVVWIEQPYRVRQYVPYIGEKMIVFGKIGINPQYKTKTMFAPVVFKTFSSTGGYFVTYKDIRGISDENISKCVRAAMLNSEIKDPLPEEIRTRYRLYDRKQAYEKIHFPQSQEEIMQAQKRFVFDDLLTFSIQLENAEREMSKGSSFNIRSLAHMRKMEASLPYQLTQGEGQKDVLEDILTSMKQGRRVDAVIQGDVGCGKSIVAFLLMMAAAENGGQSVMMASTAVLARQHYEQMKEFAQAYGYRAALLAGKQKAAEKREILAGLKNGSIHFLIGTHSVFSDNIAFENLALAVMDEEHKYGVNQRKALIEKGGSGLHVVSMSATPIPRSVASTMFSGSRRLYSIRHLPAGRLPVKTAIYNKEDSILKFIQKEVEKGRQAYVVCPLVERDEEKSADIRSVEDTFRIYESYFAPVGIRCAVLTSRTKKEEADRILQSFTANEIQILIATTVVEVGVNVPNASVIVINSAERFGMASLHQLRGRVGRSGYQSYCILNTQDTGNERLKAVASTTDGFQIAEMDMKLRGAGNLVGVEQTGRDKYLNEAMQYPAMFAKVREIAAKMYDEGTALAFLEGA